MSTTVREEYEVGDLDPAGVLEAAAEAEQSRTTRRVPQAPARRPLGRPPPRHCRHRCRDVRWGGPPGRRVARRGRHPGRGGVHPRTVRVGVGHVPVGRGAADRRRPRPAPPPPHVVETRWSVGGAGLAGPPGRPPDPPPPQGRRDLGRRTARRPRYLRPRRSSTGSSPRPSPPTTPRTHEDREDDARAGWDVTLTHPEATDFLGTSHLEATGDTLVLKDVLRPGLRHRPPAVPRRRHHPLGVRKVKALGILTGQPAATGKPKVKVYARVEPATSNPTPSPSVRSRSSAPPPSPRSATGSATTKSSSNPSST